MNRQEADVSRKISRLKLNGEKREKARLGENEDRRGRETFTRGRRPGDGVEPGKHQKGR